MNVVQGVSLAGVAVLIVEDELIVAMDMEDVLLEQGAEVLATVPTVSDALAAIEAQPPDLVVLDLNLDGQSTVPIVQALNARSIPFVVVSGYGDLRAADPCLAGAPMVTKPWNRDQLLSKLLEVLTESRGDAHRS